ncbi:MAG TPA: glycosyltransferase family 39 protein [Fimbriimonadales bacterium]|nr:glycosyltransferase family 39 protein [Fimbriimonadales bacterium]
MSTPRGLILWLFVFIPLYGFWSYGLFDLDEGLYAAATKEMLLYHKWVIPTIGGEPFLEKPILLYWSVLPFLKVGMFDMLALRLPSVLATVLLIALAVRFVHTRFGESAAVRTLCICAASPLLMGVGRMMMPDALFALAFSGACFSFWKSLEGEKLYRVLSSVLLGFAVLAKGPVAVVLFSLIFLIIYFTEPEVRFEYRGRWGLFIFAFICVLSTWYVPIGIQQGKEFLGEFIWKQNILRFLGGDIAHRAPLWFYIPVFFVALAPWSFGIFSVWRKTRSKPTERFFWIWGLSTLIFFSLSGSKLPHYILPAIIPFAALFGIAELKKRFSWAAVLYGAIVAFVFITQAPKSFPVLNDIFVRIGIGVILATLFSVVLYFLMRRSFVQNFAIGWSITVLLLVWGMPKYWEQTHGDVYRIGQIIRSEESPFIEYRMDGMGEPLKTAHPSLYWYTSRTGEKVQWLEELVKVASPGKLLLTRKNRLGRGGEETLRQYGLKLNPLALYGDFELYRVIEW